MATQRYCQVVVSWSVDDGRSVEDVVIYNIESDFEDGQMPSSTLDSLTDLFLSPPVSEGGDPGPPCTAHVSVRESTPGLVVAAVDVLSSARNVEVFSSTGEYLVLAEGTRLDVAGERKLFLSQHTFDQPQPTCDLKFVSLVDAQTLWLHSLHLTLAVDKTNPAFPLAMGPSIDMNKVNAIMADMDAEVPDRAKGLMSAMTSIQKNKERAMGNMFGGGGGKGPPTMASIMGMFATMGVTSRMTPATPAPAAPTTQPQSKLQQPPQGKAETTQNNPGTKTKRHKKSGKKGSKNGGGVSVNAETEGQEGLPEPKQEQQKQSQPKSRPNSGEQTSQSKGKKQKDNNKKDSEDSPCNESLNKKKSGSNSNNKNSASTGNSNSTNSGSESSKKNSGSDSARSKKEQKGSSKEAKPQQQGTKDTKPQQQGTKDTKPQQQGTKDTKRSDSVDIQATVTQADLAALEQRLLQRIDKSEEAIVSELTLRIEASEQRIMQHMESLVSKMATAFFGGGSMMNGSGRMDEDLTPD